MTFFESPAAFFSVYIPLVLIAAASIIFEEKFVALEKEIFEILRATFKKSKRKKEFFKCLENKNKSAF